MPFLTLPPLPTLYPSAAPSQRPTVATMVPTSAPTATITNVNNGFLQMMQYTDAACATTPIQQGGSVTLPLPSLTPSLPPSAFVVVFRSLRH